MDLLKGQVVVSEVHRTNVFSCAIAKHTQSSVTHTFLIKNPTTAIEAHFPRVREISLEERFAVLRERDQAYAILDLPQITEAERDLVVAKAESYIGRFYDVGQALIYAMTGEFFQDGTGTLVCSRLETGSFWSGANINLFPCALLDERFPVGHPRRGNLAVGYATPADLLNSRLEVVAFQPSSHVRDVADFLRP